MSSTKRGLTARVWLPPSGSGGDRQRHRWKELMPVERHLLRLESGLVVGQPHPRRRYAYEVLQFGLEWGCVRAGVTLVPVDRVIGMWMPMLPALSGHTTFPRFGSGFPASQCFTGLAARWQAEHSTWRL